MRIYAILMCISSVKPVLWLLINLHHLFSNGAAVNAQSRSSLTSYAISCSISQMNRIWLWTRYCVAWRNCISSKKLKTFLLTTLRNPLTFKDRTGKDLNVWTIKTNEHEQNEYLKRKKTFIVWRLNKTMWKMRKHFKGEVATTCGTYWSNKNKYSTMYNKTVQKINL